MLFSVVDIGLKKEKKNRDKEGGKWVRHMKLEYEVTENDRRKEKEKGRGKMGVLASHVFNLTVNSFQ